MAIYKTVKAPTAEVYQRDGRIHIVCEDETNGKTTAAIPNTSLLEEKVDIAKKTAEEAAEAALDAMEQAKNSASVLNGSLEEAASSASAAADSASAAADSATRAELSESWAVGGTGKRDGEDSNNSKYWAEQAAESASKAAGPVAGVTTFNGRSGDVKPQTGDYSYDMITGTPPVATETDDGLMSAEDKVKLDGIEEGANKTVVDTSVSENSANPVSGGSVYAAIKAVKDSIVSTVTASIDAVKSAIGNATTSAAGLMSGDDKSKLDGIATGATNVSVDADVIEGSNNAASSGGVYTAIKAVKDSIVSTVTASIDAVKSAIGNATTSAAGLMTAAQVTKLDGIEIGANKTNIVNNLTATIAGSALDAVQGKALSDSISSLNSSLTNSGIFLPKGNVLNVGYNITVTELFERADNSIVAFSNWNDTSYFPFTGGTGFVFPTADASIKYVLYLGNAKLYGCYMNFSTKEVSWTKYSS